MIEKTLSTFPTATSMLAQRYRLMKIKKYSKLMQHLLLAETQHQILLRNNEMRPPREIHNTMTHMGEVEAVEPVEPTATPTPKEGVGAPKLEHKEEHVAEAHATEASRRPTRGSFQKPNPKWHKKPPTCENNRPKTYPHRQNNNRNHNGQLPISVERKVILLRIAEHLST